MTFTSKSTITIPSKTRNTGTERIFTIVLPFSVCLRSRSAKACIHDI